MDSSFIIRTIYIRAKVQSSSPTISPSSDETHSIIMVGAISKILRTFCKPVETTLCCTPKAFLRPFCCLGVLDLKLRVIGQEADVFTTRPLLTNFNTFLFTYRLGTRTKGPNVGPVAEKGTKTDRRNICNSRRVAEW